MKPVNNKNTHTKQKSLYIVAFAVLLLAAMPSPAAAPYAQRQAAFLNPPATAGAGVFWDWMGGMISREGITKDLEALAAQGIGRVMIMQMPETCPYPRQWSFRDYPGKVKVLSDEWFALVNFAIEECDRLEMQLAIFSCPGWGHVGGPWVPPDKGTKQLAVTNVRVTGPVKFDQILPKPPPHPISSGGNIVPEWNRAHKLLPQPKENFFRDEAVLATPDLGPGVPVPLDRVVVLSDKLDAQGRLVWDAPQGKWIIRRFCLVSENGINHPAPPEALGLESDRMDSEAVGLVFDGMVGRIQREAKAKGYKSFFGFETDSYETGWQDYGVDFREQFKKRRGYDCIPWLPAWRLPDPAVVESPELTARFQNDMLRTISELWAERFQGTLRKLADENGLQWLTQPYFKIPLDWTTVGSRSAMVGEEFWVGEGGRTGQHVGNAPEIAGTYGQPIVWAEAFTAESHHSAWRNTPWILKRSGDEAFARGVNLFFMHGFVHNPFPDHYQPGLTMGYWGTQLSRHLTWWPMARAWTDYLARNQSMLQAGRPTFDVLRYPIQFERNPTTYRETFRVARLTDEVLQDSLSVRGDKLVLPFGGEFSALQLTGDPVRPDALEKIKRLVEAGAVLIGNPPPRRSASLENYPECDRQMARLIDEIWGADAKAGVPSERASGKGRVLSGMTLEQGMKSVGRSPDFQYEPTGGRPRPELRSHLRVDGGMRFWFISHQGEGDAPVEASFAVAGYLPEWWDPLTGEARDLPRFRVENGRTIVPLKFGSWQSGFVVFRKPGNPNQTAENKNENFVETKPVMEIQGPWRLQFNPRWGGPAEAVGFAVLSDWSSSPEAGIKYFSGTAVYRTDFQVDVSHLKARMFLDLGKVHDLARVKLNGRDLGIVWCAPWRLPIPQGILKKDGNTLEIEVVNTWVNRLIGDEQEPDDFETEPGNPGGNRLGSYAKKVKSRGLKELPDWLINGTPRPSQKRYTFSSWLFYDKLAPLQPSGLLGPVMLQAHMN